MIVHLVELEMDGALHDEYLAWLREHVAKMLALPGFLGAGIMMPFDPPPPEGRWVLWAQYRLRDHAVRQSYLAEHAPRMRDAGHARFGDRVKATRRVLEIA